LSDAPEGHRRHAVSKRQDGFAGVHNIPWAGPVAKVVAVGDPDLKDASRAMIAGLESPLTLQVFVTPT
jgi:hypothetical protein